MWKRIAYLFFIPTGLFYIWFLLNFFFPENDYRFSNNDGSFTFEAMPSKSRNLNMMLRKHKSFVEENSHVDTLVYRTFKKNYWKIWQWPRYWSSKYYRYPYKKLG